MSERSALWVLAISALSVSVGLLLFSPGVECAVAAQRQSYIVIKQQTARQQFDALSGALHLPPFAKVFRDLE